MATWLVTGADRGIGASMCMQIGARGDTALAACFAEAPELRGKPGVEVLTGVDVTSAEAMRALVRQVGDRRIDVLVNNAGLVIERKLGEFDYDAFHREYAVNALGPLVINYVNPADDPTKR